ncbi:hypothetical protein C0993_012361 [Termitomyces sp. T159_Od127]|nr:hypothetical protein C0993_012361 [Termitomyces sp. T159_Od127]
MPRTDTCLAKMMGGKHYLNIQVDHEVGLDLKTLSCFSMAAPSQSARDSAIGSPRSQRSVRKDLSTPLPEQQSVSAPALRAADENALNIDSVVLDSGTAQQPHTPGSSRITSSSKGFAKLSQLAKKVMRKPSIGDSQRRAEEGRPSASARGFSPLGASPAGSSSHTIHDTDAYEGTTAVSHENHGALTIAQTFGSPIYVEPKPTNDYAKMESPRASIVSFNSYIHRVRQFFHELNDLPWVAERVTVDYIPGAERDRRRPRVNRPTSWYGNTPHSRRHSLFSDSLSPTSQPSQARLPPPTPLHAPALYRSISAQQEHPQTTPPQPNVSWQTIDPNNPSDAPYAIVVPSNWSFHQPLPLNYIEPTGPIQQSQSGIRSSPEPQQTANPSPTIPQQPASTWSYPGRPTDGFQRFVPIGETYPTGYVPYEQVESVEAAYQDRRIHPRPQDFAPQDPVPQPSLAGTDAAQTPHGGFGIDAPQTARGLDEPFTTSLGQAGSASLPVSSVQTPYNPNDQPSIIAPIPREASWSTAPPPVAVLADAEATPRATVVSLGSPRNPPSAAASRTTRRSHGRAPSVHTVQSGNSTPSVASSHASRVPSAANQTQTRSRPPSLAPSHVSRPPSAAAPAMTQTPNRPPSAALSHASRAPSARASQSRPVSVARSHASGTPPAGTHTPGPMQFPQPVIPPLA